MTPHIYRSSAEALDGLEDGMTLAVGGFGTVGNPYHLIDALVERGNKNLIIYSNNPGTQVDGELIGLAKVFEQQQVARFCGSYIGNNTLFEEQYLRGDVDVELIPQGTLAEKMRAGGAGIPAFYTPTGYGSAVSEGGLPVRHNSHADVIMESEPKETRTFNFGGEERGYVLEEAVRTDFSLIRAWKADEDGNLIFRNTAQNFNPECAACGDITVVEVEEIVPSGSLDPAEIHTPGIYVDRLVPLTYEQAVVKPIEMVTLRVDKPAEHTARSTDALGWSRDQMAERAAAELRDGEYVNLGIGLPTKIPSYLSDDVRVILQSENGILKTGPFPYDYQLDPDTINAGKQTVTVRAGGAVFSSSESFAMIRGGHVNTAVLGALEVNQYGDIANWGIPGKKMKGMGGAMDLVEGAQRVIAVMEHTNPSGGPRVLKECAFPLTAKRAVNLLITNLAVFEVDPGRGLTLIELAPGVTLEHLQSVTEAPFDVQI